MSISKGTFEGWCRGKEEESNEVVTFLWKRLLPQARKFKESLNNSGYYCCDAEDLLQSTLEGLFRWSVISYNKLKSGEQVPDSFRNLWDNFSPSTFISYAFTRLSWVFKKEMKRVKIPPPVPPPAPVGSQPLDEDIIFFLRYIIPDLEKRCGRRKVLSSLARELGGYIKSKYEEFKRRGSLARVEPEKWFDLEEFRKKAMGHLGIKGEDSFRKSWERLTDILVEIAKELVEMDCYPIEGLWLLGVLLSRKRKSLRKRKGFDC